MIRGIRQYQENRVARMADIMAAGPCAMMALTVATSPFHKQVANRMVAPQQKTITKTPESHARTFVKRCFISSSNVNLLSPEILPKPVCGVNVTGYYTWWSSVFVGRGGFEVFGNFC